MKVASRIILAAAVLLGAGPAASGEEPKLRLGTEGAYPPFNNLAPDGKLEGFDIDIGNALCAEMKVDCEWVVQDWDGMIPALRAGKFDAIVASMFITEERRKQVDFTEPYYRTPAVIAVPKESAVVAGAPKDLEGKSVGVQVSTVYVDYVEKVLTGSRPVLYPSAQEMLADLANGRLDAVNDDIVVVRQFIDSPAGACCRIVATIPRIAEIHGPGAGIAVRKGDLLLARLNAALDAMRASGEYKRINDRYFSFDIYGGE